MENWEIKLKRCEVIGASEIPKSKDCCCSPFCMQNLILFFSKVFEDCQEAFRGKSFELGAGRRPDYRAVCTGRSPAPRY